MRTTIELPDSTFREMKSLAARQGTSLKEFALRAMQREISRVRQGARRRFAVKLPLIPSRRPGALRSMTNAEIEDLLD
jgi:hypothetical protein